MIALIAAAILAQTPYGEDPGFTDIWVADMKRQAEVRP